MSEFKGTPGSWKVNTIGQHWNNKSLTHIEVTFGMDGECVCDTVYEMADANLIAAAPELLDLVQRANGKNGCHTVAWQEKAKEVLAKALGQ